MRPPTKELPSAYDVKMKYVLTCTFLYFKRNVVISRTCGALSHSICVTSQYVRQIHAKLRQDFHCWLFPGPRAGSYHHLTGTCHWCEQGRIFQGQRCINSHQTNVHLRVQLSHGEAKRLPWQDTMRIMSFIGTQRLSIRRWAQVARWLLLRHTNLR